jgi:hypothetical protein
MSTSRTASLYKVHAVVRPGGRAPNWAGAHTMAEPAFKGALEMHEGAVAGFASCRKSTGAQPGWSVDQLRNFGRHGGRCAQWCPRILAWGTMDRLEDKRRALCYFSPKAVGSSLEKGTTDLDATSRLGLVERPTLGKRIGRSSLAAVALPLHFNSTTAS